MEATEILPRIKIKDNIFLKGFGEVLRQTSFYDITLQVKDKTFRAHRILLSYSSAWFRKRLADFPADGVLKIDADPSDFQLILQFIYEGINYINYIFVSKLEGGVEYKLEESLSLLVLSSKFGIGELKVWIIHCLLFLIIQKRISSFLNTKITKETAVQMLGKSLEADAQEVASSCEQCMRLILFCSYQLKLLQKISTTIRKTIQI
jgi:hypothetical protein